MKTAIFFAAFLAVALADLTFWEERMSTEKKNDALPEVPCPDTLCNGKADGNHYYYPYYTGAYRYNFFLQCLGGKATCQACFPLSLEYSYECNQCLYKKSDACVTTKPWKPVTTFTCPDRCPSYGPKYTGNVADPAQSKQYVACWEGVTVGCIACPGNLMFNEQENACLFEGKYITEPTKQ
uniref:Chitin-binding type-2 domain-containing protein n=1 Tax=Clytia hemisphaerica TaxID=252671 RepID=A0A7M5VGL1_9CNID|eukprot:TCONS_00009343-protein